jgi:IclR family pca regulon transcriptional regulator
MSEIKQSPPATRRAAERASNADTYFVNTAARTIDLLKAVAEFDRPVSLGDLVSRLGWTKPAVYRLVRTLDSIGALRQTDSSQYVLGPVLLTLSGAALRATRLPDLCRPYLQSIYDTVHETIVLTILDGDEIVYLDRIEASHVLVPRGTIGARLPAYCSASGYALLSGMSDDEIRHRLRHRKFEPLGPHTARSIDDLLERVEQTRRRGYALNDEDLAVGHRSVAAPLRGHSGGVVAAISISTAAARASVEELRKQAVSVLIPTTSAVSEALGAPAPGA